MRNNKGKKAEVVETTKTTKTTPSEVYGGSTSVGKKTSKKTSVLSGAMSTAWGRVKAEPVVPKDYGFEWPAFVEGEYYAITLFKKLVEYTVPSGHEGDRFDKFFETMNHLDSNNGARTVKKDKHGNWVVCTDPVSRTMFASHMDDVWDDIVKVGLDETEEGFIKTTGETILGADDKTGMAIMLSMILHGVGGTYLFFVSEEIGCVGSRKYAAEHGDILTEKFDRCISFDRYGYESIITHQTGARTASNEFATELAKRINDLTGCQLAPDATGVYTDSREFSDLIPDCTNVSVGYFSQHSTNEHQSTDFLQMITSACLAINWETLPVGPLEKEEYKKYTWLETDDLEGYYTPTREAVGGIDTSWWKDKDGWDYGNYGAKSTDLHKTTLDDVMREWTATGIIDLKDLWLAVSHSPEDASEFIESLILHGGDKTVCDAMKDSPRIFKSK